MSIDIQFNNVLGSALGIYMKEKPSLPAAQEKVEQVVVPGRDGNLLVRKGVYESTQIPVALNYIGPEEKWGERWRNAKKWLSVTETELKFTDDPDVFYKISHVIVSENAKHGNRIGTFDATFITKDGLSYLESGKELVDINEALVNPGIVSKPIYTITGEGMCRLTANGKSITANVSGDLFIDTEKMICYRSDGTSQNTAVSGDYEELFLQEGENVISVTDGFECKVVPRWRCL